MATRLQLAKADARRRLHREMAAPALYILGAAEPLAVSARIHDKVATVGDIPGLETVEMRDQSLRLRFWREEIDLPKRNALVTFADGCGYRLGDALPPDGATIDVYATQLTTAEVAGLPLPE